MRDLMWRLSVVLNEGFGSFIVALLCFALAGACFHRAFATYYAQGEEAKQLLTQMQEPFRGERYPTLAAVLTRDAKDLNCDDAWHTDFVSAEATFLALRSKQRVTNALRAILGWLTEMPSSPKLVQCGITKGGDVCEEGRPPAGWRDADPSVSPFSPNFPKTDFRAPAFLDEAKAVADAAQTLSLEFVDIPKHLTSLYFITVQGSIRIGPRGRLRGSRSHRDYSAASYFQNLINEAPHVCGPATTRTTPYLDLAGAGIIETFCKAIPSTPNDGAIDGALCADISLNFKNENKSLLKIEVIHATLTNGIPLLEETNKVSEGVKDKVRALLQAGASGTGGLGGLKPVGSDIFAAVIRQSAAGDDSAIAYDIAVVSPNVIDIISLPLLILGLVLLGTGGAAAVRSMVKTRRRHIREELRGLQRAVIIETSDGYIDFGNACAESILGVVLPSDTHSRIVRLLLQAAGLPVSNKKLSLENYVATSHDVQVCRENRTLRARWESSDYVLNLLNGTKIRVRGYPILRSGSGISSFGTLERVLDHE